VGLDGGGDVERDVGGRVDRHVWTPPPRKRSRRRRILLALAPLAAVFAAGLVAAALIRVPYYSLGPGSIRATEPLVDLGGGNRDPEAGTVDFATVSVNGRLNLLQAFAGWLDPAVDVVPEERILQGRSPKENQQVNLQLMDDSKSVAVQVALQRAGLSRPTGAELAEITPGSPADGVLAVGDVVVTIAGQPVTTSTDLVSRIRSQAVGAAVDLVVRPGVGGKADGDPRGATGTRSVTRAASPDQPTVPFLGVSVRTAYQVDYEHDVTIDSGQVGGPSAGLAFTLGVIDLLTDGDLTGGTEVTATGTIRPDGSVGAIGGVQQKAAAVRRAGVKLFLVPSEQTPDELARARELAGDGVDIVPVATLDEALHVLATRGGGSVAMPRS
jgi:PDZ domain-containing protein